MEPSIQIIMVLRLGPESPDLGEAQLGSESQFPGEAKKESTAIRSRWATNSPGMGEAQKGTTFTRSGCGLGGARFCSSELGQSGDERHQYR